MENTILFMLIFMFINSIWEEKFALNFVYVIIICQSYLFMHSVGKT
jgi:hypothetical protein